MPAANPCIDVSIRLFTDLNINTEAAPSAVSSQVIIPIKQAPVNKAVNFRKKSIITLVSLYHLSLKGV